MKIRRLYESDEKINCFSNDEVFDYFRKRYEIDEITKKILSLINEYININAKHFHLRYNISNKTFLPIMDIKLEEPFDLTLTSYNKFTFELEPDDFNDFLDYIEDPELYRNAKKYNL